MTLCTVCVFYLRCYVVRSKLWGHQVSLINFGKPKVAQLHWCVLWNRQNHRRERGATTETCFISFL